MDLKQLRSFLMLVEELHFRRAAERLHVTQPALSFSIRQLEAELGIKLFNRNSKQVSLTAAGQTLVRSAASLVAQAQRTLELAQALSMGLAGRLEVGFVGTMLFRGFADMVQRFWKQYPDIDLVLHELSSGEQLEMLREGRLDAAFVNNCAAPAGFAAKPIVSERFKACVHSTSPLARSKSIPIRALADEPFVMFRRGASTPYHDYIMTLCQGAGFQPRIRLEAMQLTSVAAFVAGGAGVSILPESIAALRLAGAAFVPLEGVEPVTSAFLVWSPERSPPGLEALVNCVAEVGTQGPMRAGTQSL
jgi:DNA-binding transcriptional LysR family regulator